MDRKIQTIEMTLANNENDIRAKQDEISQKMIHQSEMTTILGFVEEKTREMLKNKHDSVCHQNDLTRQTNKCEQKIGNLRKEIV